MQFSICTQLNVKQFYLINRWDPYQLPSLRVRMDQGVVAIKGYFAFPYAPALLKTHYQMVYHEVGGLTPLQRCSRCILQLQLTGPQDTCWGSLTPPLQRCSQWILQPQLTEPQDTHWGVLPFLCRDAVGVFCIPFFSTDWAMNQRKFWQQIKHKYTYQMEEDDDKI